MRPRYLHAPLDLLTRDAQPRQYAVGHRGREPDLIGRVGNLPEHSIHQATVGALLRFQALGHLHPEFVAHLIRGQSAHFVVGSINLIEQLA